MGSPNPNRINNSAIDRYQNLKLKESLAKPYQFSLACNELSFILRNGYSKFPKNLQSLLFQDTLFALNLFPQIQMQSAMSAVNSLLQSAEFVLPKQKKLLAGKEYKQAVVASKRKSKTNHDHDEEGLIMLPQDVLAHMFSFLDFQSLVSASAVCWTWNAAARENHLWKFLYATFLCKFDNTLKLHVSRMKTHAESIDSPNDVSAGVDIDWRLAFRTTYREIRSRKFKSHRGYCFGCCLIFWVTSNTCSEKTFAKDGSIHRIKPISTQQIVSYIADGTFSSESSSDSDTDSDYEDASSFKLWAYPRQIT